MKKLMFAISLAGLLGLGASAAVQSANTFGVLKVNSSKKQTVIGVPWVKVGDGSNIAIANLVMTSNLTARDKQSNATAGTGDMLYYWDGTQYQAWELVKDTSEGEKTWEPALSVTANGFTSAESASVTTLGKGKALILVRTGSSYATDPIFLYGQYANTQGTSTIAANAWNLLAPSSPCDVVITESNGTTHYMTGTPATGDYIMLSSDPTVNYTYRANGGWGHKTPGKNGTWQSGLTIPVGTGAWYVSNASSGSETPTFTWPAEATSN